LKDRLQELAIAWLKNSEPGAIFALDHRSPYRSSLSGDDEFVYKHAARTVASVIAGDGNYTNVVEMYEAVNKKLEWLGLPQVQPGKSLIETLAEEAVSLEKG
jgi:hypothetical protein